MVLIWSCIKPWPIFFSGVLPLCDDRRTPESSYLWLFVTHLRQSYTSRTVWTRIAKFYTYLHNGRICSHTGYDVSNHFRSEKNPSTHSGGISREPFVRCSFWVKFGSRCLDNGANNSEKVCSFGLFIIIIIIVYHLLSMLRTGWTFSPNQAPPTRSLHCQETLSL